MLWESLGVVLSNSDVGRRCIVRDFKATKNHAEIRSVVVIVRPVEDTSFNRFIEDNVLVDFPLCGGQFTWYSGMVE